MHLTEWLRENRERLEFEVVTASLAAAVAFPIAASLSTAARSHIPTAFFAGALVLVLAAIAHFGGVIYAVPVGVVTLEAFDWYFLPPLRALDTAAVLVLAIFVATSILLAEIAAHAGRRATASEDARALLADEQAALRRVATLVARQPSPPEVFEAVTEEVGKLLRLDAAQMYRYESGRLTTVAGWGLPGPPIPIGAELVLDGDSVSARALATRKPSRIDDYSVPRGATADYVRSVGIRGAVGTPIIVDGEVWGLLTASTLRGTPLPPEAELRLAKFSELAATAISNAEGRAEIARLAEEQAALRRIATLVARGVQPSEVFAAVADEIQHVLGVGGSAIMRYEPDATATVVAASSIDREPMPIGSNWPLDGEGVAPSVYRTRRSVRIDAYGEAPGELAAWARDVGLRSAVGAPIFVADHLWGVASAGTITSELPSAAEGQIASFAELIATAISNAQTRGELYASRARVLAAANETRRQIERDLHDGIQQRLVSLALGLRLLETMTPRPSNEMQGELALFADGLEAVLEELREISRGIHPAILAEGGLVPALKALARRSAVPVALDLRLDSRVDEPIEIAAYYVASEALANAVKHSEASAVEVDLATRDGSLVLAIRDNGIGGADPSRGSGLFGINDRVEVLGGTVSVASLPGEGTAVAVLLPLTAQVGAAASRWR
jgi:signal transduction histidine kinase